MKIIIWRLIYTVDIFKIDKRIIKINVVEKSVGSSCLTSVLKFLLI